MSENTNTPAPRRVTVEVGGRALILETGKIAKQANGAIVARYGDTVTLNTAYMANKPNDPYFLQLCEHNRENTNTAVKSLDRLAYSPCKLCSGTHYSCSAPQM